MVHAENDTAGAWAGNVHACTPACYDDDYAVFALAVRDRPYLERSLRLRAEDGEWRVGAEALGQSAYGTVHYMQGVRLRRRAADGHYDVLVTTVDDDVVVVCYEAVLSAGEGALVGTLLYNDFGFGMAYERNARAARDIFNAYWREAVRLGDAYWDLTSLAPM